MQSGPSCSVPLSQSSGLLPRRQLLGGSLLAESCQASDLKEAVNFLKQEADRQVYDYGHMAPLIYRQETVYCHTRFSFLPHP